MPRYADPIAALLRAMIWDEELSIDPSVLLEAQLWQEADRQKMAHMLAVWAINRGLPVADAAVKKRHVFANLQRRERQNCLLTDLVTLLRSNDIEPVLLKGYSSALLYPNPDMRDYCDVDLYIGEQNYDRMIPVIRAAYPSAHWFSEEHAGLHFTMVLDERLDLIAEMHRVAMELTPMIHADSAFQLFTRQEMNRTRSIGLKGVSVSVPSLTFDALYVFLHLWHHFASCGVGLRQLADWMLALHAARREEQLAATLEPLLRQMHMLDIWQAFGWVLVNRLGLPENEFPLYKKVARQGEQLYRQLLLDGHCGRESRMRLFGQTLYCYPFRRPEKGRLRQKTYTLFRLVFEAIQLAKLFPRYACRRLLAAIFRNCI